MKLDPIIFIYSTSSSPTLKKLAKNCHWLMHSIQLRSIFANPQRLRTKQDLPVLLLCIKWYSIHRCMHRPKAMPIYQDEQKYFIPNKPDQSRRWIPIDNFCQANIKSSIQVKNTFSDSTSLHLNQFKRKKALLWMWAFSWFSSIFVPTGFGCAP